MTTWKIKTIKKVKLNKPVLIEGMPGIGNVGKIAADLIVEQLKAEKMLSFFSYCLPNSVFVKEDSMIELPKIEMLYKKKGKTDFLFLVGDVQPMREEDSYRFAEAVLDAALKHSCSEIITLGGIGLQELPKKPRVFCTGNDKKFVQEFVKLGANDKLYGVVGPIMGISGLLLGLSKEKGIRAASLLAETYGHPMHIGLREAKELMAILEKKYKLGLDMAKVEKDIKKLENEIKPIAKQQGMLEQKKLSDSAREDASYIG
ncbi:MAG TPA: PAC2 family protein [Candidatus Nanoarchaeia archaeon]|nr:PAC2 family protein [Candidatus Nanoarchaeia archaeon]